MQLHVLKINDGGIGRNTKYKEAARDSLKPMTGEGTIESGLKSIDCLRPVAGMHRNRIERI
jgi:hypothetical protein